MNIIDKYRKELIILGVIIEIILVPLIVRNMNILKNKEKQDENIVPVMNEIGKQEFGLYYRDSLAWGYDEYTGTISDALNSGYALNVLNSVCKDESGTKLDVKDILSTNGNIITVKSNKTVYCTLAFDKLLNSVEFVGYVSSLTKTAVGGMYRFQGTGVAYNNICFGTFDAAECLNDPEHYLYRIIGIDPNGYMKIIKQYGVTDGGYAAFPWDVSTQLTTGSSFSMKLVTEAGADWNNADLFKRLNGASNGTNVASNTDLFIDNPEYSYLKSGDGVNGGTEPSVWHAMIAEWPWKWGRTNTTNFDADALYNIESGKTSTTYQYLYTGSGGSVSQSIDYSPMASSAIKLGTKTSVWNTTINSRISLLYLHDLAYSLSISGATNIGDFKNSWLYYNPTYFTGKSLDTNSYGEWYSTGYGVFNPSGTNYSASSRAIFSSNLAINQPAVGGGYAPNSTPLGVRPVFYLRDILKYYGRGTPTDPFMLSSLS